MTAQFEVAAEKLSWRCDLSFLPFTCTAEMTPLEDFIGQERAIRAIEFGLGVNKPGFNIFVTGLTGTGKTSIIKAFLKKVTSKRAAPEADSASPEDWCYVYNFSDPDRPQALKIRRGWGKNLKTDMERLVQTLQREAKKTFESEDFAHQRQGMIEQLQRKQQEMMEGLMEEARRNELSLRISPSGIMLIPTKDGKPMQEAEYLALSTAAKKALEERRSEIEEKVEAALREGKKLEREINEKLVAIETQAGEYLVRIPPGRTQREIPGLSQNSELFRRSARPYPEESAAIQGYRRCSKPRSDDANPDGRAACRSISSLPGQCLC